MANLTATSRQTVTTVLNDLKAKDLIYMERKRFLIREINKLV
jgi:predicted transcriptional regulator